MTLNIGKLPEGLIREMMTDVRSNLANLLQFEQFCDVRSVDVRQGALYLPITPLEIATDGHRTSETAPGAPTPRANTEISMFSYKCQDYKWMVPLEEGAEKELSAFDISTKFLEQASSQTLWDFNKKIASTLNTLTLGSTGSGAWDTNGGKPLTDIQPAIKNLRGLPNLCAVMGFDVAQALSLNPQITGSGAGSGTEVKSFSAVIDMLTSQGITEVYIDGSTAQTADARKARAYKGAYDGVFAVFAKGNLFSARFQDLRVDVVEDKDRDERGFKAKHSHSIGRAYQAHGYYWTGILT